MTLAVSIAQGGSNNVTQRNRIINGAMVIDQRNAGASVSFGTGYTVYLDRWQGRFSSGAGSPTIGQSSTAPAGFVNSLLATNGTVGTVSAASNNSLFTIIEGYNIADLNWGTSNAKPVTLSFWVRSSLTGTFGGSFQNYNNDRSYPFTYTISSANTYQQITITIAGDTTGTWNTTNSGGIVLWWDLGFGSNYQGTAGAWAAGDKRTATGVTQFVTNASATFYITGVQLEAGTTASPFEYRQYGTELALCQRYYQQIGGYSYIAVGIGINFSSSQIVRGAYVKFNTTMRSAPSASITGTLISTDRTAYDTDISGIAGSNIGIDSGNFAFNKSAVSGNDAAPTQIAVKSSTTAYLVLNAEL